MCFLPRDKRAGTHHHTKRHHHRLLLQLPASQQHCAARAVTPGSYAGSACKAAAPSASMRARRAAHTQRCRGILNQKTVADMAQDHRTRMPATRAHLLDRGLQLLGIWCHCVKSFVMTHRVSCVDFKVFEPNRGKTCFKQLYQVYSSFALLVPLELFFFSAVL